MIERITYEQGMLSRFEKTDTVKIYVIKPLNLPCCRMWENDVLIPCSEKYYMFKWYEIITNYNDIPFPPVNDYTFYFVCPGEERLHFKREGNVDFQTLDKECAKFLKIQNGEDYADVLNDR